MCRVTQIVAFIVLSSFCSALAILPPPYRCDIQRKCSNEENLAWAALDGNCAVFQNDCQFQNYNCQRIKSNEKALTPVSRENCLKNCPDFCNEIFDPFCTIHDGKSETVSNACFWKQKMCQSGNAYVFQFKGACAA